MDEERKKYLDTVCGKAQWKTERQRDREKERENTH